MSASNLDKTHENLLVTEIAQIKQNISQIRTVQQQGAAAVNLEKSSGVVISWDLLNSQRGIGVFKLENLDSKMLFAVPSLTFYEGSIDINKEIGYGQSRDSSYTWGWWNDWGSSNGNNLVVRCWIVNSSGSSKHIEAVCDWRFIVSPNSVTAIA